LWPLLNHSILIVLPMPVGGPAGALPIATMRQELYDER
jgi:hypothetical protein